MIGTLPKPTLKQRLASMSIGQLMIAKEQLASDQTGALQAVTQELANRK